MVQELKQMGIELMISPYFHSVTKQSKNFPQAGARSPRPLDFPSAVLVFVHPSSFGPKEFDATATRS